MGRMDDAIAEEMAVRARYKQMPCKHCGDPVTVGVRTRKAPAHIDCSIEASIEAARQMREKKGPYYERWLRSMSKMVDNAPTGGVPPVDTEG